MTRFAVTRWLRGAARGLGIVFSRWHYLLVLAVFSVAYLLLYLYSLQYLLYLPDFDFAAGRATPSLTLMEAWRELIWRVRGPFLWEPIGTLYLTPHLIVHLAVPNVVLGTSLALLVGANLTMGVHGVRYALAQGQGGMGVWGSLRGFVMALPGLFSGFACCVPIVVVALGSSAVGLAAGLIAVQPYLIPLALLLLITNLLWSSRQVTIRSSFIRT